MEEKIKELRTVLEDGIAKAEKFINKVETGRARSRETYADLKAFVEKGKEVLKDL